jgi:galactonate dehydratase
MVKIKSIEYFRVLPRWLFVKIVDEEGQYGWGESTLEGHTEAVEGTLNALCKRFLGYEAEYALRLSVTVSSTDRLTFLLQRY